MSGASVRIARTTGGQLGFSLIPHNFSTQLAWASSLHGGLKVVKLLIWWWLPPESALKEDQRSARLFMTHLQKSHSISFDTIHWSKA